MRITICAVGRMRTGPEQDLIDHYLKLLKGTAPRAGFTSVDVIEIDDRKSPRGIAGQSWQAEQLLNKASNVSQIIALDENGKTLGSPDLAKKIGDWRDQNQDLAFLIGGPDGHGQEVLNEANFTWALGPATWPHMLVRALVIEQIYRSSCILTGHPYHHG
jgi:23S rRNA (pseudouridine1915-N3)-methyltransferase